jgi:hypothetical protein
MENMKIENAQYIKNASGETCAVNCVADGVHVSVPLSPSNRYYAEILKQVDAGTLTIAEAE